VRNRRRNEQAANKAGHWREVGLTGFHYTSHNE
jgi:hypothetical protein